jgi:hypothetical protein
VVEDDIQTVTKRVNELTGIKESDTGLAAPALWDLAADKQTLQNEQPLQVSMVSLQHGNCGYSVTAFQENGKQCSVIAICITFSQRAFSKLSTICNDCKYAGHEALNQICNMI